MEKFDVIGDVHGCYDELLQLLAELGYLRDNQRLSHPQGRIPVFLGDLTDRGPSSLSVMEDVALWVQQKQALYAPGNHCNKLYRYLLGRNVMVKHGLETTVDELQQLSSSNYQRIADLFIRLYETSPLYLALDDDRLITAHAGIRPDFIGLTNNRVKSFVLYGDITGEKDAEGRPVRRDWASKYDFDAFIVYGHTPVHSPRMVGNTINIDTGCVFGGSLTAFRWPEKTTYSVPSRQPLEKEKFQSFE